MSNRIFPFAEGEYYHIYNRGNSKQVIFKEPSDYKRFQALLYLSNSYERFVLRELDTDTLYKTQRGQLLVHIEAYCLMPNHFHILVTPQVEGGVSHFMKKISTGYSMYFNRKYKRSGSLFEGRFKSQHANTDEYLRYLYSYIHLNPIKLYQPMWKEEGIKSINTAFAYLDSYEYSSYIDLSIGATYGKREEARCIQGTLFRDYFTSQENYQEELLQWLQYNVSP